MPPTPANKNFVVVIGGPGTYKGCDPEHDQTWSNYIVPIQVATKNRLLNKDPNEIIHWFVYAPAYNDRWNDDSSSPPINPALAENRKAKADRIIYQGSSSYMNRIENIAANLGIRFKKISKPQDIWTGLAAFPDNSVSRVWYIGHASDAGFMLKIGHNANCDANANRSDMLFTTSIRSNYNLIKNKIIKRSGKISKFLGCYTNEFAMVWSSTFEVTAEGAKKKIDFGVTDRPSTEFDIIKRLQHSNADTGWQTHVPRPLPVTTP